MVFCFFQKYKSWNIFLFAVRSAIFFPEFNIRSYDKNSESHYFFFLYQKSEYFFFSIIGNQNIFLEKNPIGNKKQKKNKLEAARSLYSSPGYNNNISQ